jgi:predicted nucleic acid-binding protein
MILVVADTAPLCYLVQIGYEGLLPQLFGNILIPSVVVQELRQKGTPGIVSRWADQLPSWIEVRKIAHAPTERERTGLDLGEWEAIQLAKETNANLLLMDERFGVRVARQQGFTVTGTLGVLVEAARSGLISIDEALARLAKTNFRRTGELFAHARHLVDKSGKR